MEKLDFLFEDTGWINEGLSCEGQTYVNTLQYRKRGNKVYLKGNITAFPESISVTLPKNIIPKDTQKFKDVFAGTVSNSNVAYNYVMTTNITINNTGTITFNSSYAGSSVYGGPKGIAFDGICYLLD